jgi:hypothetical protein
MAKWADCLITKVRYNAKRTHIERVKLHKDNDSSLSPEEEWAREHVVRAIGQGWTFRTAPPGTDRKLAYRAKVEAVTVRGERYIRTDANATPGDNLGSLPEF